jgi:anti-anti-sigma factor
MTSLHRQSEVTVLDHDPLLVVQVAGDITMGNSLAIGSAILSAWDESDGPHAVIVDLGDVPHMDSSGLGTLLQLRNRAKNSGVPLILCRLQRSSRRLLDRTGLAGLFQIWPTVEEAMLGMPTLPLATR